MNFEVQAETHRYSLDQISLWHKNKLQCCGHMEAAAYLDMRISNTIVFSNAFKPCSVPKDLWEWVNKIMGQKKTSNTAVQFDAEVLNGHCYLFFLFMKE